MQLLVDTHCHTISSGHAYSTITEIAQCANQKGLKMIAMTDHGPSVLGGPNLLHLVNMRIIPDYIYGVRVLKGVEANVIDMNGKLDVPDNILERLELVIAGFHDICIPAGSVEENTRAMIGAMQNPLVDIIAHPGNPVFAIDIDKVIQCAADTNTLIEINNASFAVARKGSAENCKKIAMAAKQKGIKLAVGSDSHICFDVGRFEKVLSLFEEVGMPEELVMHTDPKKLVEFLRSKGKKIEYCE